MVWLLILRQMYGNYNRTYMPTKGQAILKLSFGGLRKEFFTSRLMLYKVFKMQQDQNDTICIGCNEAITNPICPDCLERGLQCWLENRNPELVSTLKQKTAEFKELTATEKATKCVLCGKGMNSCTYCYTEYIYDWLRDDHPILVKEFIKYFNFDLRGEGYRKDAEDLHLI